MKFIRQHSHPDGVVEDIYKKTWRGHRAIISFFYEPSKDPHWDGEEELPSHYECYDVRANAVVLGFCGTESCCNYWIDPQTEGPRGSNFLYESALELLEEAFHNLGIRLARSGHSCTNSECVISGVLET